MILWLAGLYAALVLAVSFVHFREPIRETPVLRFFVWVPEKVQLTGVLRDHVGISPDGRRLAYAATSGQRIMVWVYALDSLAAQPLAGTEDVKCANIRCGSPLQMLWPVFAHEILSLYAASTPCHLVLRPYGVHDPSRPGRLGRLFTLLFKSQSELAAENLFLRKQLALFQERKVKPTVPTTRPDS